MRVEHPAGQPASRGARLFSVGGYLLFGSLLLMVVLAGIQLFAERPSRRRSARRLLVPARDPDARGLDAERDFVAPPLGRGTVLLGAYSEETPPVESLLDDPFRIGRYEVTNDQYYEFLMACAAQVGEPVPQERIPASWSRRTGDPLLPWTYPTGRGDLPVVGVTYRAALEFCAWFWETRLGADPTRVADLPTVLEFVRAGRRDRVEANFPWGRREEDGIANLSDQLLPVDDPRVGEYDGIHALVGNAAEWVHDKDERGASVPTAAGWSFARTGTAGAGEDLEGTPFARAGMVTLGPGERRLDLGFRLVIRDAPSLPAFVPVEAGTAHFPDPAADTYLRVDSEYLEFLQRAESVPTPDGETPTVEEPPPGTTVQDGRIHLHEAHARVATGFQMARSEITNRQYLFFLLHVSERSSDQDLLALVPGWWNRPHPLRPRAADDPEAAGATPFRGPLGAPLPLPPDIWSGQEPRFAPVYAPGEENLPVRGITPPQARAYCSWLTEYEATADRTCRLPTVAEFLLAGRGEGTALYPWGDSPRNTLLVCEGFRTSENRPVSLLGRFGAGAPPLVGLAGNLLEWVTDGLEGDPAEAIDPLLAGGCYALPPEGCTLDSIIDRKWLYERPNGSVFDPDPYTGFRVVRVPVLP